MKTKYEELARIDINNNQSRDEPGNADYRKEGAEPPVSLNKADRRRSALPPMSSYPDAEPTLIQEQKDDNSVVRAVGIPQRGY